MHRNTRQIVKYFIDFPKIIFAESDIFPIFPTYLYISCSSLQNMIHFIVELLRTITAILEKEGFYAKKECRQCRPDKWSNPRRYFGFYLRCFSGSCFSNFIIWWMPGLSAILPTNNAFAAVSSTGTIVFLIIGFFAGIATGGGVIISRYFGAQDEENVSKAVHTNFLIGSDCLRHRHGRQAFFLHRIFLCGWVHRIL